MYARAGNNNSFTSPFIKIGSISIQVKDIVRKCFTRLKAPMLKCGFQKYAKATRRVDQKQNKNRNETTLLVCHGRGLYS